MNLPSCCEYEGPENVTKGTSIIQYTPRPICRSSGCQLLTSTPNANNDALVPVGKVMCIWRRRVA